MTATLIKEELSNTTTKDFCNIVRDIETAITSRENKQYEKSFLSSLAISYENKANTRYLAYASSRQNVFDYEEQNLVVFNVEKQKSFKRSIVHEVAHLVLDNFASQVTIKNGWHCLEFAIVAYCIEYKIFPAQDYTTSFFRSYDIHEDVAYSILSINVCQFDSFIKSVEWHSLQELCEKAIKFAEKIRARATL